MDAPEWEAETYRRLLILIGGQTDEEGDRRARKFLAEFKELFPDAEEKWDSYCRNLGIPV